MTIPKMFLLGELWAQIAQVKEFTFINDVFEQLHLSDAPISTPHLFRITH